jgi:hypothetical protein
MYGVLMAGALAMTTEAYCTNATVSLVGADRMKVVAMLGPPTTFEKVHHRDRPPTDGLIWKRVDWLGTWRRREVEFCGGIAETDITECKPFAVTPLWLKYIWDAVTPPEKIAADHRTLLSAPLNALACPVK